MDTPSNFKERESRVTSPAATEERLSRLEGDVAEIKDSLATILRLVSSNKEINKEVESPNSKLESESASEDMLEPAQKVMNNQIMVTAAPPKFAYYLTLKSPYDTYKFLEGYNMYKLANPGVANTMNLTSYVKAEMLSSELGLRESVLQGRQSEMPDSLTNTKITFICRGSFPGVWFWY